MSVTRKVAFNTIVQVVGKAITTIISLVIIGALTRYLGVRGFGQYTTAFAFVALFSTLADFGFFWILVREVSKKGANLSKIANNVMTMRALWGAFVFLLVFVIAWFIPSYDLTVKLAIGIVAAGWFWIALNSTFVGVFQSQLRMDKAVLTDVIGRLIILSLVFIFIHFQFGLHVILLSYFIGDMINFLASAILARKYFRLWPAFNFAVWRTIAKEAIPMGVILILSVIYYKIDTVILSVLKSQTDVGIYGAPFKILEILVLLPQMFLGAVFPILTRYISEKDPRVQPTFQKSFDFLVIMALPIVAGIFVLARPIISVIGGQEFVAAAQIEVGGIPVTAAVVLQILIFAVGVMFISNLFNFTIIAKGYQRALLLPNIFFVLVNVGLNLILIPHYTYLAAAASTVVTQTFVTIWTGFLVYKFMRFAPQIKVLAKALISVAAMVAVLWFLSPINLFLLILLGIIVYFAVLFALRGITKEMLLSITRRQP